MLIKKKKKKKKIILMLNFISLIYKTYLDFLTSRVFLIIQFQSDERYFDVTLFVLQRWQTAVIMTLTLTDTSDIAR
jgi:hypothetical protein